MTLTSIRFLADCATLVRREGTTTAPVERITRTTLAAEQQAQWDIVVAALNGLLAPGERVLSAEINRATPAPIAHENITHADGMTSLQPTAWRDTLAVAVAILQTNKGQRRVGLNTEQFSSTAARDALLALWAHLAD